MNLLEMKEVDLIDFPHGKQATEMSGCMICLFRATGCVVVL